MSEIEKTSPEVQANVTERVKASANELLWTNVSILGMLQYIFSHPPSRPPGVEILPAPKCYFDIRSLRLRDELVQSLSTSEPSITTDDVIVTICWMRDVSTHLLSRNT